MQSNLYSGMKLKNVRREHLLDSENEERGLSSFIHRKTLDENELTSITKAFCYDLKGLLELSDLKEIISGIFRLENHIFLIKDKWTSAELLIPELGDFYKSLAPMLLRGVWEFNEIYNEKADLNKSLKESLRVSLEEELYYWQKQL